MLPTSPKGLERRKFQRTSRAPSTSPLVSNEHHDQSAILPSLSSHRQVRSELTNFQAFDAHN